MQRERCCFDGCVDCRLEYLEELGVDTLITEEMVPNVRFNSSRPEPHTEASVRHWRKIAEIPLNG